MENENQETKTRHIQVSNEIKFNPPNSLKDALVYAYLRSYMNSKTNTCYPSMSLLSRDTELDCRTINKSIKSLIAQNLITVHLEGKKKIYTFTDVSLKSFEPFSYEFLSSLAISARLKGYWILLQQYTFKDDGSGYAKTTYTDVELSSLLKIPLRTIQMYNRDLKNAGVMSSDVVRSKNDQNSQRYIKLFNLSKISQDMFFVKEQLNEHDKKIEVLQRLVEEQNRKLAKLEKKINADNGLILE